MKIILIAFTLLSFSCVCAQQVTEDNSWNLVTIVDDFGDPTGESVIQLKTVGKFSNSATSDSNCKYIIRSYPKVILIDIYPYDNDVKESFTSATQQVLKVKSPDGKKYDLKVVTTEEGTIVLNKKSTKTFKSLLEQKGIFMLVMNYVDQYSTSRYEFNFYN